MFIRRNEKNEITVIKTHLLISTKSYLIPFSDSKKSRKAKTGAGHGKAGTVMPEYVYVMPGSPYATCCRGKS